MLSAQRSAGSRGRGGVAPRAKGQDRRRNPRDGAGRSSGPAGVDGLGGVSAGPCGVGPELRDQPP
eukprot:12485545-Alexandrium_andersonii.AAC.1